MSLKTIPQAKELASFQHLPTFQEISSTRNVPCVYNPQTKNL